MSEPIDLDELLDALLGLALLAGAAILALGLLGRFAVVMFRWVLS